MYHSISRTVTVLSGMDSESLYVSFKFPMTPKLVWLPFKFIVWIQIFETCQIETGKIFKTEDLNQ